MRGAAGSSLDALMEAEMQAEDEAEMDMKIEDLAVEEVAGMAEEQKEEMVLHEEAEGAEAAEDEDEEDSDDDQFDDVYELSG